jgi:hypothetical protein
MFELRHSLATCARLLAGAAALAVLAACSSGAAPTLQLTGSVVADQPITGGSVSFALPGAAAFAQANVGGDGKFQATSQVPEFDPFVVSVTDLKRADGSALPGTLQAVIAPADAGQPIQVNLLSTLVAQTYLRLGPNATVVDAQAHVVSALALPAGTDLRSPAPAGFYPAEFLGVAEGAGGLDNYVANAATAIAQNQPLDYRGQFRTVLATQLVHKLVMGMAGVVARPAN